MKNVPQKNRIRRDFYHKVRQKKNKKCYSRYVCADHNLNAR